ncbi:hypothetical protein L596_030529 [Steinernema carpocapsae]|uniref:Uncharacterized protein n=1 Tax=Steinernema carpocapsae TaxID=34508 RepID=A0A4V5ZX02_STECR|nr:hypothetical protein L596_030529 [Steinernema carpocapsae]
MKRKVQKMSKTIIIIVDIPVQDENPDYEPEPEPTDLVDGDDELDDELIAEFENFYDEGEGEPEEPFTESQ